MSLNILVRWISFHDFSQMRKLHEMLPLLWAVPYRTFQRHLKFSDSAQNLWTQVKEYIPRESAHLLRMSYPSTEHSRTCQNPYSLMNKIAMDCRSVLVVDLTVVLPRLIIRTTLYHCDVSQKLHAITCNRRRVCSCTNKLNEESDDYIFSIQILCW